MKLFYAPLSPYSRKCRVVIHEKGLVGKIELVEAMPLDNPFDLVATNPLGTVPALLLDDGNALCESPIICEYLNTLAAEPRLIPAEPKEHFAVLGLAAIADGVMDAAVVCVYEIRRPENQRSLEWMARKEAAIKRSISVIAKYPLLEINMGTIASVCALSYVSFRLPHLDWRTEHATLAKQYDELAKRQSFVATAPAVDTASAA